MQIKETVEKMSYDKVGMGRGGAISVPVSMMFITNWKIPQLKYKGII